MHVFICLVFKRKSPYRKYEKHKKYVVNALCGDGSSSPTKPQSIFYISIEDHRVIQQGLCLKGDLLTNDLALCIFSACYSDFVTVFMASFNGYHFKKRVYIITAPDQESSKVYRP